MSNVTLGGATVFPIVGARVEPINVSIVVVVVVVVVVVACLFFQKIS